MAPCCDLGLFQLLLLIDKKRQRQKVLRETNPQLDMGTGWLAPSTRTKTQMKIEHGEVNTQALQNCLVSNFRPFSISSAVKC